MTTHPAAGGTRAEAPGLSRRCACGHPKAYHKVGPCMATRCRCPKFEERDDG